jgi:hypothetical protein
MLRRILLRRIYFPCIACAFCVVATCGGFDRLHEVIELRATAAGGRKSRGATCLLQRAGAAA